MQKSTENDKEADANTTVEDGPGEGFTILSAKSLFLGQKVDIACAYHTLPRIHYFSTYFNT